VEEGSSQEPSTPLTRLTHLRSYISMYIVFVLTYTLQSPGERQVGTSR
jgi:hypothetical protein